jgi:two-component system cell cycle response regulator
MSRPAQQPRLHVENRHNDNDVMTADRGNRSSDPRPVSDGRLVLVVEDDPETRRFLVSGLTGHGFRTAEAHNGLQALEKAFAAVPDLVLADIAMPGIDGIELCRRLRADPRTHNVSILAITGYDDRHYRDRALHAGADRLLTKPCDFEALLDAVRALVDRSAETA